MPEAVPTSPSSPAPAPSAPAAPAAPIASSSSPATSPASVPSPAPAAASPAPAAGADRPAYVPEVHWDAQAGKVKDTFAQHVSDLTAFRAADEVRRNALPQKAEDYKYELPKD